MAQERAFADNGEHNTPIEVPERPALNANVRLIGEMKDAGFKDRQWLVRRGDKFIQTTELLYRVAEQATGERTLEEVAEGVTESTNWLVSADDVRRLIQVRLIPLGLIAPAHGSPGIDEAKRNKDHERSLLQIRAGIKVLGPRFIAPITRVLQVLFVPPILIFLLTVATFAHGWLYFAAAERVLLGLYEFIYNPALILVTVPLMVAVTIFHEFGHASALRYGGGETRGIGIGIYIIDPVIYTDTTDNYRLGRWARVRTDLGGFYFWLIAQLLIIVGYLYTGQEFLLFVVVLLDLEIISQLLPFARYDGYWALASLTGIPDLFSRMRPKSREGRPIRESNGSKPPDLKPWVRRVYTVWVALTVPVMALFVSLFIWFGPRFLAAYWDSFLRQAATFSAAMEGGNALGMTVAGLHMFVLAVNILIVLYFAYLLVRVPARALWGKHARGRRGGGALVGAKALWNWGTLTRGRRLTGLLIFALGMVGSTFFWAPGLVSLSGRTPPDGVQSFADLSSGHTEDAAFYGHTPPVGGDHAPVWQNCGFYVEPVKDENAVHSMEHGAVWITYRPDLPKKRIEAVHDLTEGTNYVLASPYPGLPAPVVVTAWGKQLRLDSPKDPRLDQFIRAFSLGPQTPEPGAPCSGGKGVPR